MRRASQQTFTFRTHGGARQGAGRPPKGAVAGVSHLRRPALSRNHPVHATLRISRGLASMRSKALFSAVRAALAAGKCHATFRLIHFSVQRDHLHLLVEAGDRSALARGLQALSIRVARAVNRALERAGRVFADRYYARALKTPNQVRLVLRYLFGNVRKHAPSEAALGHVDERSSAPWFDGFSRPVELAFGAREARLDWLRQSNRGSTPPVCSPRTWLLRVGYRRAGPLDVDERPAAH